MLYLLLCKAEPSKCFTVSNLFDLGMYFVSMNNLLAECIDYTLVILGVFGEKTLKGDSLLSNYCVNISGTHY